MTQAEMKSKISARIAALETRFSDSYEKCMVGSRRCFLLPDGTLFALDCLGPYGALVIEYAENIEDAKMNRFEDGDLFYLENLDEETMYQAMLSEIEL